MLFCGLQLLLSLDNRRILLLGVCSSLLCFLLCCLFGLLSCFLLSRFFLALLGLLQCLHCLLQFLSRLFLALFCFFFHGLGQFLGRCCLIFCCIGGLLGLLGLLLNLQTGHRLLSILFDSCNCFSCGLDSLQGRLHHCLECMLFCGLQLLLSLDNRHILLLGVCSSLCRR